MLLLTGSAWNGSGQTMVDLSRQGRLGTGTILPAVCTAGQLFFKTDAPAGSNLNVCSSTNTWTAVSGTGGAAVTAGSGTPPLTCSVGAFYQQRRNRCR